MNGLKRGVFLRGEKPFLKKGFFLPQNSLSFKPKSWGITDWSQKRLPSREKHDKILK